MKTLCVIIALIILPCDGQLSDLFPRVSNMIRSVAGEIINNPFATIGSQMSSGVLATTVDAITKVPVAVARSLRIGDLPILLSSSNIGGSADNIIADYNIGLGNEDSHLDIIQIANKYGYSIDEHQVLTQDGYILTLFRIPNDGPVVFLMHGLLGSADDYVIAGPEGGLAYLLSKEGYDVWMGNARGNKHSRRHRNLRPNDAAFWDFSWHEIGVYDLPAMIDYALNITNEPALKYIGHSQGTTTFFVMASEKPEYNSKVALMVALSPVAFMSNVRSPVVMILAPGTPFIHSIARSVGLYEFLPDNVFMRTLKVLMCGNGPLTEIFCSNILFLMTGFDFGQLNVTNLPVIYGHTPCGASAKQFAHYGQGIVSGEFKKFDYGPTENLKRYGAEVPSSYNLQNVVAPVSLFYSDSDWLAHPIDVDILYNELGNAIDIYKVPYDQFNHLDFIWAKDFKTLIYRRLRKLLSFF